MNNRLREVDWIQAAIVACILLILGIIMVVAATRATARERCIGQCGEKAPELVPRGWWGWGFDCYCRTDTARP